MIIFVDWNGFVVSKSHMVKPLWRVLFGSNAVSVGGSEKEKTWIMGKQNMDAASHQLFHAFDVPYFIVFGKA